MSYNHQEFPKIQINQEILKLTEKEGFGNQQIASLKTKLTAIQHIYDKNHARRGLDSPAAEIQVFVTSRFHCAGQRPKP